MTNSYWNHSGKYQVVADLLEQCIPVEGPVENLKQNKMLEKFRKASNCYYDLYNNGLCNRASEFNGVFKIASSRFKCFGYYRQEFRPSLYERTEVAMDEIVCAAAVEQGLALHLEYAV